MRLLPRVLGLLGIVAFGLAAYLFLPSVEGEDEGSRPPRRILLVDASASARRLRPAWTAWARAGLRDEALAAEELGEEVAVIPFATDTSVAFGPADPRELLERIEGRDEAPFDPGARAGADTQTEFASALRVAASLLAGTVSPASDGAIPHDRLVLFADGGFTGDDPAAQALELFANGVAFEARELPPPTWSDLALLDIELPSAVESEAPLVAIARLAWTAGVEAVRAAPLTLELEHGGLVELVRHDLELPPARPGQTVRWEVSVPLGAAPPGRLRVDARAALVEGVDPVPENDRASATTVASGELTIGVVASAEALDSARRWLAPSGTSALPGLGFVFLEPRELLGAFDQLDAVVSFDMPLDALPAAALEAFVLGGGGWLAVSGWSFLADWFPDREPGALGALLPLEPAPLDQRDRDVILLVDGSGSMAGEPFDAVRAATLELVAAALPGDRIGLRFFTTGVESEYLVRDRAAVEDEAGAVVASRLLAARVPGGQTMILRSLEQFAESRRSQGTECLALLLTDGRERETQFDAPGRSTTLLGDLDGVRTRLRVVAVGDDPDLDFLALLVRPGEAVTRAEGLGDLESIFRRAVGGARVREGEALPVRAASYDGQSLVASALGVRDPLPPRPVRLFVRNRVRPGGEVAWVGPEGEPVLGVQRAGAGRTALLATCPQPEWAPAWCDRPGAGEPAEFGPLLRWLARWETGRVRAPLRLTLERDRLRLSGVGPAWPLEIEAELVVEGADLEPVALRFDPEFRASGADLSDRRTAPWPEEVPRPAELGPYGALVRLQAPAGTRGGAELSALVPVTLALPPELGAAEGIFDLGLVAGTEPGAPQDRRERRGAHPAAPWVLGAGLVAWFLAALLGRKAVSTIKGLEDTADRGAGAAADAIPRMEST